MVWDFTRFVELNESYSSCVLNILATVDAFYLTDGLSHAPLFEDPECLPKHKCWLHALPQFL